ncbi:MAG: glycosyltransferase family 4 protein, partial [Actinomycetota bacterium]|nr:glycosyltransferase family 4 protein [Actinomycetota bacterium]
MSEPLVVLDADVLGRRRTGDETYVERLLHELPAQADGFRLAAVTRRPELLPAGIQPILLTARSQELRMLVALPRLLRRVGPALAHFVHAIPPRCPCPAVLTVQDLSFERDPKLMGLKDRLVFKAAVPRSARRAVRVLAISERTKADLVELYGLDPERIVVTPLGVDPAFSPGGERGDFLLFVGAIQERKDPRAAALAARELGRRLVVVGPAKDERLADELRGLGAELRGYVEKEELAQLYREAACLVFPSRYEGFGLPVLEAMASGTPVVAAPDAAVREVADGAAVYAEPGGLAAAVRDALER